MPLLFALALVLAAACTQRTPAPPGSLVLAIDTNLTPGRDFERIEVRVGSRRADADSGSAPAEPVRVFRYAWDETAQSAKVLELAGRFPITLTVANEDPGVDERFATITAWAPRPNGEAAVFHREVSFVVPSAGAKVLRVPVEWLCFGDREDGSPWAVRQGARVASVCEGDPACNGAPCTCIAGRCAAAHVNASALPPFDERALGADVRVSCSDPFACFGARSSTRSGVDFAWKTYPISENGTCGLRWFGLRAGRLSVALLAPPGSGGRCTADGCIVPLRREDTVAAPMAWSESLGVALPEAVCRLGLPVLVRDLDAAPEADCAPDGDTETFCAEWTRSEGSPKGNDQAARLAVESVFGGASVCPGIERTAKRCETAEVCGAWDLKDASCNSVRAADCGPCNGDTAGMVRIEGGTFTTGLRADDVVPPIVDAARSAASVGTRRVYVAPFWLDRFEVTVDEFIAFCNSRTRGNECTFTSVFDETRYCNFLVAPTGAVVRPLEPARPMPSHFGDTVTETGKLPANCVNRSDAVRFCAARGMRLPSEDEFEFAARNGGRRTYYPWGTLQDRVPAFTRERCTDIAKRLPLTSVDVTADGVVALASGVGEWTSSAWSDRLDHLTPMVPGKFVVRGATDCSADHTPLERKRAEEPTIVVPPSSLGFRCAR
jgi:formylglycine-generating enzyme required for sulfatase activity